MQSMIRGCAALALCGLALVAGGVRADEPVSAGDCFVAATNAGDADAVAACYAEDAVLWFPGGPMVTGREAIRDGFAAYFAGATLKDASLTRVGQEAVGDAIVTWGTYSLTLVDNVSHVERVDTGSFMDMQKLIDGKWLYTVDHPAGMAPQ
jgi:uncharacterized protein (TIGR02246 family)